MKLWAAWHIERHRDRIMTFIGVFDSKDAASAAIAKNLADNPVRRDFEYTIWDCELNQPQDW